MATKINVNFNRISLIQLLIEKLTAQVYLEIGIANGSTFKQINCRKKIAVDPEFSIKWTRRIKHSIKKFPQQINRWKKMTSDDFFATHKDYLIANPPKVIFIDGLHTFNQTLRDCYNSLNCLDTDGFIVLHDCSPPHQASAIPALSIPEAKQKYEAENDDGGWTGEWCGDTWKTIPYLIKHCPELNVCVLNADYGLGVVSKRPNAVDLHYANPQGTEEFQALNYADLVANREGIINLKEMTYLDTLT